MIPTDNKAISECGVYYLIILIVLIINLNLYLSSSHDLYKPSCGHPGQECRENHGRNCSQVATVEEQVWNSQKSSSNAIVDQKEVSLDIVDYLRLTISLTALPKFPPSHTE